MNVMTIRRAHEADIPTIVNMWNEASSWLCEKGYDQWQYPIKMHNLEKSVTSQTCWIVESEDKEAIGTVTLDENADLMLWHPSDEPDRALYLHRLVVRIDFRKNGLGSAILDWASLRAQLQGKTWLRLDAWTSNEKLHLYYLNQEFRHVRTVKDDNIVSGALFERLSGVTNYRGHIALETHE